MKGYKLLRRDPDTKQLYSMLAGSLVHNGNRTCYRGTTKQRKGAGPLCVFTSEVYALRFNAINIATLLPAPTGPVELWQVEYTPSRAGSIWDTAGHRRGFDRLPDGTRLASSVKLIERLRYL